MDDAKLLVLLHQLGMDDMSHKAVALLPLVQVAWADGTVQDSERDLILKLATDKWDVGDEGRRLLGNWLRYPPSAEYFRRGREALRQLAATDGEDVDVDDVVDLARKVAKAAGGLFGFGSVSRSESDALAEIAGALGVAGAPVAETVPEEFPETFSVNRVTLTVSTSLLDIGANDGVLQPDPSLGAPAGHRIPLTRDGVVVGSDLDAAVIIESADGIAPHHARFFERDRKFYVQDLDTEHGTFVNGERIAERRLLGGEEVVLGGGVKFQFKLLKRVAKQLI